MDGETFRMLSRGRHFGFFSTATPDDGNMDFNDASFQEKENNHHYFEPHPGRFAAFGLAVIVYSSSHYYCLLTKSNSQNPFFSVGEDLPDLICKSCKIDPVFWKGLSIREIMKSNKEVAISQRVDRETLIPKDPHANNSYACTLHRKSKRPKYSIKDLNTILFDGEVSIHTTNQKASKILEEISLQKL